MGDRFQDIQPADPGALHQIGGIALLLIPDRHQHIADGRLFFSRGLNLGNHRIDRSGERHCLHRLRLLFNLRDMGGDMSDDSPFHLLGLGTEQSQELFPRSTGQNTQKNMLDGQIFMVFAFGVLYGTHKDFV